MKINWVDNVALPAGVGIVNIGLSALDQSRLAKNPAAFKFQQLLGPVGSIGGLVMKGMNYAPDKGAMIAAASIPMFTEAIYNWARGMMTKTTVTRQPVTQFARSVSNYPTPQEVTQLQRIKQSW